MDNWMQYVSSNHKDKVGKIRDDYYFPHWLQFVDNPVFTGNFRKMDAELRDFEWYCNDHVEETEDLQIYQEFQAMVSSVGVKPTRNFAVCNWGDYDRLDKKPEYYFCWETDRYIDWKFPGGFEGEIWI